MGAGASIEDTGDLKKEYEKVKPNLTETQKTTLEETYKKVEGKNEFLIIGKCKKAYAELGIEGADPAFLPKEKKAAAPPPTKAPEPKKVQGPAPEGVTRFSLLDLPAVVKAAVESGKTPLILDPSEDGKVDTFYTYGKGARLLDAKALSLKHTMAKKPVDECLEEARKQVVSAMKQGLGLVVACQQAAVDFSGKFAAPATFPLALFDGAGKGFVTELDSGLADNPATKALFRDEDTADSAGLVMCATDFHVVVTSRFLSDDYDEYLFASGLFPAKDKFAVLEVDTSDL